MFQLYVCERLNARISQRQCEINRNGTPASPGRQPKSPCLSCWGCPGLGATQPFDLAAVNNTSDTSVSLNPEPVQQKERPMANKRATCPVCKRKDVLMPSGQKCSRCYDRQSKGLDPVTGRPIAAAAPVAKAVGVDTVELLSIQKTAADPQIGGGTPLINGVTPPPQETALEQPQEKPARKPAPRVYPTPEEISIPFTTTRDADLFFKLQSLAAAHRRTLEAEILFQLEDRVMQIENIYLSILDK